VLFPMDLTWTETAHRAGSLTGLWGYPVSPLGTLKVAFASTGYAKFTLAPAGNAAWIDAAEHDWFKAAADPTIADALARADTNLRLRG
jgi:hypothetical protein